MTIETMMTQAATTTEGTTTSEQALQQPATGAGEGGQQQQATEGQGAKGQQAEGTKTEGDQEKKAEGAPESYKFTTPEGQQFDDAVIGAFSKVATELNLPQDKAQRVLDKMAPVIKARQLEQFEAARVEWADAAKVDKEFGGEKLGENLGVAKKALDAFATPELRTLLEQSGLGNHPEVIRMFYRAGKAISEDRFVSGRGGKAAQGDARSLYPNSKMN